MNNLDEAVAEDPQSDGLWRVRSRGPQLGWLPRDCPLVEVLENDETLMIQSGKPVAIFRTLSYAPRMLIANANLVPHWATRENSVGSISMV